VSTHGDICVNVDPQVSNCALSEAYSASTNLLAEFKGEGKKSKGKRMGETWVEQ